jgi:PAS domain S-box-containing protein
MAESVHEGAGAKPLAKTGAENPAPTSGLTGTGGGRIGELLSLSRHLAEVAERLDSELRVSGSWTNQELNEQREAYLRAEVEIANLRLQLEGERDRRHHAENELLQLRKALETMQLGVTIADQNGIIVYVNPADARIHGHTVDELLGKDAGIYAVEFQHRPLSVAKLRTLRSFQRETFNRRKDGSIFKVRLLSDVVWNSEGDPVGLVTMCEELRDTAGAETVDGEPPRPKSSAGTGKKKKKDKM